MLDHFWAQIGYKYTSIVSQTLLALFSRKCTYYKIAFNQKKSRVCEKRCRKMLYLLLMTFFQEIENVFPLVYDNLPWNEMHIKLNLQTTFFTPNRHDFHIYLNHQQDI